MYLLLYAPDNLHAVKDKSDIEQLKPQLRDEFKMKDLGAMENVLGCEFTRIEERTNCAYQRNIGCFKDIKLHVCEHSINYLFQNFN